MELNLSEKVCMFKSSDHSFVVCAYGESPYLEECIQSLQRQSVQTKVLVSTSTPNDHITSIAKRYGVNVLVNEGEPSIAHDWNCAVSHCGTKLLTIAHQDDCYEPKYVEKALQCLNSAKRPLIFFTNYRELRDEGEVDSNRLLRIKRMLLAPLKIQRFSSSRFIRRRCISLGCSICCPSVTFVLDALPKPIFTDGYKSNLDWEAWEKISLIEGDFLYCSDVLMGHRIHEGSETSHLIKDCTRTYEDLDMLSKFWPEPIARVINFFYIRGQLSNGS